MTLQIRERVGRSRDLSDEPVPCSPWRGRTPQPDGPRNIQKQGGISIGVSAATEEGFLIKNTRN